MKLLVTTDSVGGVWQYTLALLRGLVENHDCTILLVCIGDDANEQELAEAVPSDQLELVRLPLKLEWMSGSGRDVRLSMERLDQLIRVWHPHLVHSNQYCFGALSTDVPVVVVGHSDVLNWYRFVRGVDPDALVSEQPALADYGAIVEWGVEDAAAVVAPTGFVARSIEELYGRRPQVIYNGLWQDRYKAGPKEPFALLAGRIWDEAKGAAIAAEGMTGVPLQLRLVGPARGPSGETAGMAAAGNARYLGSLSWRETRDIMSAATYYMAASSYEPFGLAALEAAFSGCALVANDIPSYRELWEGAASFYRNNDPRDLREKLSALMESPEETARLGELARRRALERYTADRMARDYYALYRGF